MAMSSDTARQLLGITPGATGTQIVRAYEEKAAELDTRIAAAPTAALQEKFRQQRKSLEDAMRLLTGDDESANFPVTRASVPAGDARGREPGGDRFLLGEKLADTPLGPLYLAHDTVTGADVSLCRVPGGQAESWRQAFRIRADSSRHNLQPQAGGITDAGEEGTPYYAAEPLQGLLLRTELDDARRVRRQIPAAQSVRAVAALARALAAAHPAFVHGDIRPETVWLCPDGSLRVLGFAAPGREPRPADDQAGLAALLWEMLAGRPPAALREDLMALRPDTPPSAARALQRALHHDRAGRFPDLRAFASALGREQRLPAAISTFGAGPVALAVAAVIALGAAAYTYPQWKAATPWETAAAKQRATTLAGLVRQLKAQQDSALENARRQVADSESAMNALADKRDGLAPGAYSNIVPRYYRAQIDHAARRAMMLRYEAQAGTLSEAEVAEAEALLAAGEAAAALPRLEALEQRYRAAAGLRQAAGTELARERLAAASALTGRWSDGACAAGASVWRVSDDGMLRIDWPGHGEYVERVLGAQEGAIFVEGVSQNDAPGQLVRYTPVGNVLTIDTYGEQHMQMRFNRC